MQIGIAKDVREDLIAKFKAARRANIIISSGGVSLGDYKESGRRDTILEGGDEAR
jgi:molybdopterin biosynthesis enzyme